MSDSLRDRIAAATAEAITTRPIPTGGYDQEDWLRLADAVIAELRKLMLEKADDYVTSYAAVLRDFVYRVTDWESDDE